MSYNTYYSNKALKGFGYSGVIVLNLDKDEDEILKGHISYGGVNSNISEDLKKIKIYGILLLDFIVYISSDCEEDFKQISKFVEINKVKSTSEVCEKGLRRLNFFFGVVFKYINVEDFMKSIYYKGYEQGKKDKIKEIKNVLEISE